MRPSDHIIHDYASKWVQRGWDLDFYPTQTGKGTCQHNITQQPKIRNVEAKTTKLPQKDWIMIIMVIFTLAITGRAIEVPNKYFLS